MPDIFSGRTGEVDSHARGTTRQAYVPSPSGTVLTAKKQSDYRNSNFRGTAMSTKTQTSGMHFGASERTAMTTAMFIVGVVISRLVLMRAGLTALDNAGSLLAGLVLAAATYFSILKDNSTPRQKSPSIWPVLVLLVVVYAYLVWMNMHGVTLPANDPIADATYSSVIGKGNLLNIFYKPGDGGHTYPPGVPLLLGNAYSTFGVIGTLRLFKWLCILAVGIMPLSWAWAADRLFNANTSFFLLTLSFYVSAFCIERTLNYALPIAGKNSQLIMLTMFPAFLVMTKRVVNLGWRWIMLPAILLCGLILVHFSALHLAIAVLATYVAYKLALHRHEMKRVIGWLAKPPVIGVLALALFVLLLPSAIHDTPSTLGSTYDFAASLKRFAGTFLAEASPLAIYNNTAFQKLGSPLRGYVLAACVLACWFFRAIKADCTAQRDASEKIFGVAICLFGALTISVAFGTGLINTGVNMDFARWYSFPLQFSVIACALFNVLVIVTRNGSLSARAAGYAGVLLLPSAVLRQDTWELAQAATLGVHFSRDIRLLERTFTATPAGCFIHSPNQAVDPKRDMFAQRYHLLEYAEMSTPCTLADGAWVHRAINRWEGGNETLHPDTPIAGQTDPSVYFVGTADELATYAAGYHWQRLTAIPETPAFVWKKVP